LAATSSSILTFALSAVRFGILPRRIVTRRLLGARKRTRHVDPRLPVSASSVAIAFLLYESE